MAQLFENLKRRNVFRVGAAYAIVGWLLVEVASVLLPAFNAPESVFQIFAILVALGFPITLVMAWAFEITPEGIKRDQGVDAADSVRHVTGRKLDFAIIGLLVVALGYTVIDGYLLDPESEPSSIATAEKTIAASKKSIAVFPWSTCPRARNRSTSRMASPKKS
jgi:hypothetical protein